MDMTHIAGEPAITGIPLTGKSALLPALAEESARQQRRRWTSLRCHAESGFTSVGSLLVGIG
jgi:hypothetical protein